MRRLTSTYYFEHSFIKFYYDAFVYLRLNQNPDEPEDLGDVSYSEEGQNEDEAVQVVNIVDPEPTPVLAGNPGGNISETASVYSCQESKRCKKVFKNADGLKKHIDSWHKAQKRYVCQECGKSFHDIQGLKTHQELYLRPLINCELCDKALKSQCRLKQHMDQFHTEINPECHICGKTFDNRTE